VVIITGASTGRGRELAHQLAEQEARLVLAARIVERLEAAKAECQKRGAKAVVIPTDVDIPAQCAHTVQGTMKEFGRIDALINNDGITMWGNFDSVNDLIIFEQIMRVNYLGSLYCTHYALPFLKQTKGLIVGVSSLAEKAGIHTRSGYVASKHAMKVFF
jgi:NAD(P)-dependent dehydrogenase (short-subunit alcohol dehydrogenase family)